MEQLYLNRGNTIDIIKVYKSENVPYLTGRLLYVTMQSTRSRKHASKCGCRILRLCENNNAASTGMIEERVSFSLQVYEALPNGEVTN